MYLTINLFLKVSCNPPAHFGPTGHNKQVAEGSRCL